MPPIAIILWAILLGSVVFLFIKRQQGKKKYQGVEMSIDHDWYQNSLDKYQYDNYSHQYFFHWDKNFLSQGHLMEDRNHKTIYEAKFLYNNVIGNDEVDFYNHIIDYKHHHQVSHTTSSSVGANDTSITVDSTFKFDNKDVYDYLNELGYDYNFIIKGLAYEVEIIKNNEVVSKIYSSNNGKNFFSSLDHHIEAKMGGRGICVVESKYEDLDATFLYAMAFARTDLSTRNLH